MFLLSCFTTQTFTVLANEIPKFRLDFTNIKTPQLIGIICGFIVFITTISVVIYLLFASGTISSFIDEMKSGSQSGSDSNKIELPSSSLFKQSSEINDNDTTNFNLQPQLYDHLLNASKTLPIQPNPSLLVGKTISIRPFILTDVTNLIKSSDGSAQFGDSAYDPARIWGWMNDMQISIPKDNNTKNNDKNKKSFKWPSYSCDVFKLIFDTSTTNSNFRHLVIMDNLLDKQIGMISLINNAPQYLSIRLDNVWITPAYQGKKKSHDAVRIVLKWLFDLGYRRVTINIDVCHIIMRKFLERCGFIMECILKKHMIVSGRNRDTAIYTMLNSDWNQNELKLMKYIGIELNKNVKKAASIDYGILITVEEKLMLKTKRYKSYFYL
jgi:RimJ/RimL family protein N-acetyltransferase